jgi:hypothetical protein
MKFFKKPRKTVQFGELSRGQVFKMIEYPESVFMKIHGPSNESHNAINL